MRNSTHVDTRTSHTQEAEYGLSLSRGYVTFENT